MNNALMMRKQLLLGKQFVQAINICRMNANFNTDLSHEIRNGLCEDH